MDVKKYIPKPYDGDSFDGYTLVIKEVTLVDLLVFVEEFRFYTKYISFRNIKEELSRNSTVLLSCILYLDNQKDYVVSYVQRALGRVKFDLDITVTRTGRERSFVKAVEKDPEYRIIRGDKNRSVLKNLKKEIKFVSNWHLDGDSFGLEDVVIVGNSSYTVPSNIPLVNPPSIPVDKPSPIPTIVPVGDPSHIPVYVPLNVTDVILDRFFSKFHSEFPTTSVQFDDYHSMYRFLYSYFKNQQ